MGYTHSWLRPRELDRQKFAAAVNDCRELCKTTEIPLQGIEGIEEPVFREYLLAFNGGCEPLIIQCVCDDQSRERRRPDLPGVHFGYCKTEHLSYDLCVQACLIVLNHHFGADFIVNSDGDDAAWNQALELCERELGYGGSFSLSGS